MYVQYSDHLHDIANAKQPIHHINFDINLLGDCDVVVTELARRAGWDFHHAMIPEKQRIKVVPVDEADHSYKITPLP